MTNILPNKNSLKYSGARSVSDVELIDFINNVPSKVPNTIEFLQDYKQWIDSTHTIAGWKNFNHLCFSNGTTESFDKFYHRYPHRRLRLLKGEYVYHQIIGKKIFKEFDWIEDVATLQHNDVVAISLPFADTGNVPLNLYAILDRCEELKIPVLLDLAYINLTVGLDLNLDYKCIDTITSSLSKVFPVSQHRIGIRLQQEFVDDTLIAYNQNEYINLYSAGIGHEVIKKYSADYSFKKYRSQQLTLCKELSITPSSSFIFGVDSDNLYPEYNRGSDSNRLCLSNYYF